MLKWLDRPDKLKNTLQVFLVVVVFCGALMIVFVQPLDGDTWWHLRAGEITFEQKRPLSIDVFSYTRFGEAYTSHSWLTDLMLFLIYTGFGFRGLSVWIGVLALITLLLMYTQMEGPGIIRAAIILIAALLLVPFLKARPQMISLVFLLGTAFILDAYHQEKKDLLIWLLPIFVLWSNLHGGFIIGIMYLILFIAGDYIDGVMDTIRAVESINIKRKRLLLVLVLCLIVVIVHPMGFNVWGTLFTTMNSSTESNMIMEWSSPDFHELSQQVYLWWLLAIMVILSLSKRRPKSIDLISLVIFTAMGFIWRRNLSFMVVFGAIILSKHLWGILASSYTQLSEREGSRISSLLSSLRTTLEQPTPRILRITCLLLTAVVFAASLLKLYILTTSEQISRAEQQMFPVAARTWIEQQHPEGYMMNSYNWGGYFDWNLRDYPVFLDSRADLFGDEIIGQWLDVMNARGDWQGILDRWNISFIVVEPAWRIIDILPFYGWEELYRDGQAVIFGRIPGYSTQN